MSARPGAWRALVLGLVLVAALPAATATAGAVGAAGPQDESCPGDPGAGGERPGERLADAIGEQRSAIESELDERRFEARLADATTPADRAAVVGGEVERIESRLDALEVCRTDLVDARAAGPMPYPAFRENATALLAEVESLRDHLNRTAEAAATLAPGLRAEYGVGPQRLADLETRTLDLRESLNETLAGTRDADG